MTNSDEITAEASDIVGDARPQPLATLHGRRVRDDIRARLFDVQSEPERIGRYEVIRKLGQGALGVVYACKDARLGREVAVKVMRAAGTDAARLRREAMAMAQLADPNVARVYEVGEHDGRIYIAMELVDGATLRAWQQGRGTDEIVAAYVQAGRGLAAAHEVGLVHRDFKPDNVIVGNDGRVRVLDFGLACADDSQGSAAETAIDEATPLAATLTRTGGTVGTPAYMAIEQLRGASVDARADQYSFGVALYEALVGERPFRGDSLGQLADAIRAGTIEPTSRARALPAAIAPVIRRALAADADARWPDMPAMLAALVPTRRRTWPAIVGAVGAVGVAAGMWALATGTDPCAHAADGLAWDPAGIRKTLREQGALDEDAEARIVALDERASTWRADAIAVCRGTGEELDLRRACVDDTRAAIEGAAQALGGAPPLSMTECLDLRRAGRAPSQVAGEYLDDAARVRDAMKRTTAAGAAGEYAQGLSIITPALELAREIGDPVLLVDALLLAASIQSHRGDHGAAEQLATEAYERATAAGMDRVALRGASLLVEIVGYAQRRGADGEQWARTAESIAARLPADDRAITDFLVNRGLMRLELGRHDEARDDLERALSRYDSGLARVPVLSNLAHLALLEGQPERAHELLGEEITTIERERAADHPDLVGTLVNRSQVLTALGRWDDARADLERAREICTARDLAADLHRVRRARAELAYEEGDFAGAHGHIELALEGLARQYGMQHPLVYSAQVLMARVRIEQGDLAGARSMLLAVATAAEAEVGADTGVVGDALLELARVEIDSGDYDAAWRNLERARPLTLDDVAGSVTWLSRSAQVLIGKGGPERAIDGLEKIEREQLVAHPRVVAELELTLARAHAGAGHPRAQWRGIAESARERWRARGWTAKADAVDAWLAQR